MLLLQLLLLLVGADLLVLQFVADDGTADCTQSATDQGSSPRIAYCGSDNRAGTGSQNSARERSFLALAQRLAGTSCNRDCEHSRQGTGAESHSVIQTHLITSESS
jgi:hypothetical protein